jgi:hypothetical protein
MRLFNFYIIYCFSENYETCHVFILGYLDGVVKIYVQSKTLLPMIHCNEYIETGRVMPFVVYSKTFCYVIDFLQSMNFFFGM